MATNRPVLVVGGRITGLMMAAELSRHGVPVRIIDKSPGIDPHARATYLRARTLEIFHGLGLAEEILARGQPLKAISLFANGKHVATSPDPPWILPSLGGQRLPSARPKPFANSTSIASA